MKEDLKKVPEHLGLIIDGNGRWAKSRGLSRSMGHKAGFNRLEKISKECFYEYNIPILSVYCFSTENWNRPKSEVDYLREIFEKYVTKSFVKKYPDVRLNVMGDYTKFGEKVTKNVKKVMEATKDNTKYVLNLGINYSGKDELVKAVQDIVDEGITDITRETIDNHLYTHGQPPVDFLIRTSGEHRLSNFMLWQLAYAEFYFPKCHWPAFTSKQLLIALKEFQSRDRRFGAIKE